MWKYFIRSFFDKCEKHHKQDGNSSRVKSLFLGVKDGLPPTLLTRNYNSDDGRFMRAFQNLPSYFEIPKTNCLDTLPKLIGRLSIGTKTYH